MKFSYPYGSTPVNEDEASDLIPTHIYLQEELNEYEEANILIAARKYSGKTFEYKEILDFNFLLEVHKICLVKPGIGQAGQENRLRI